MSLGSSYSPKTHKWYLFGFRGLTSHIAMTNATMRRSTTRAHTKEIVFVTVEDMSKDLLISYINVMRGLASLDPLTESKLLNERAKRKAYYVRKKYAKNIGLDRSPFSIIKKDAGVWIQRSIVESKDSYAYEETQKNLGETPEYLSSILSTRCASFGIHECDIDTHTGRASCMVQILEMVT